MLTLAKCCERASCGICNCCCSKDRPYPILLFYAVVLNGFGLLFSLIFYFAETNECTEVPFQIYLLVYVALFGTNISFNLYVHFKFIAKVHKGKAFSRLWELLKKDVITLIYLIWILGVLIFNIVMTTLWKSAKAAQCDLVQKDLFNMFAADIIIMYIFIIGGVIVAIVNTLSESCRPVPIQPQKENPFDEGKPPPLPPKDNNPWNNNPENPELTAGTDDLEGQAPSAYSESSNPFSGSNPKPGPPLPPKRKVESQYEDNPFRDQE